MNKSDLKIYPDYFQKYIHWVEQEDLLIAMEDSLHKVSVFFRSLPQEKWEHRYEPEKWSIKEVVAHLTDSERIMGYRALTFARNDKTTLPGYDQDNYVINANVSKRSMVDLIPDYCSARKSNLELFKSFDSDMLARTGVANRLEVSVLLIGFVMVGHGYHHMDIVRKRYL